MYRVKIWTGDQISSQATTTRRILYSGKFTRSPYLVALWKCSQLISWKFKIRKFQLVPEQVREFKFPSSEGALCRRFVTKVW